MASIYDIVYDYIETFFKNERLVKEDKKTIHQEIANLLKRGWCSSELMKVYKKKRKIKPTLNVSKLFSQEKMTAQNLLEPKRFYYHNQLRLTCSPPKRTIDYDSGEIKIINEPYFLEMKASYTVDDLTMYYAKQIGVSIRPEERKRYVGSFHWLLKHYTLEEILFMIDVTINYCQADDLPLPHSPLDIQKYYREAKEIMGEKKTEAVLSGGNRIVRKKRTRRC